MTNSSQSSASKRLVILVSGGGSNLQSFIDGCANCEINATVSAVISNNPDAGGLERAAKAGIPNLAIDHRAFESRESFDLALSELIDSFNPDLVILAGFMRILTPDFVDHFLGRMMNIHPSLLPAYPGLHTHRRAIEAGDKKAGATVHFVTPELDGGPSILQAQVSIEKSDDESSLASKVLAYEHKIYPEAVRWFCDNRLRMDNDGVKLDNKPICDSGIIYNSCEPTS
ncbi:phosphoribosylglycinamide formyltransferase [Porticoccaceae bacterium]|jgi:phosphoribosylglycinamide formyltransferase 1|nr:phosphoribosylglycinamide formyltransferase [Porticoccaceae bacterium]